METSLLTHNIAKSLLYPEEQSIFTSAEQKRAWSRTWAPAQREFFPGSVLDELWDSLLVRTYDPKSGSQPCPKTSRMVARGARMRLDNEETRIKNLETHADHEKWEDTPYISFTNCSRSLEELANYRRTRRGRSIQRIVVIDPRIRIELGLPILHYGAEMAHYQVKPPYGRDYWRNHYLCLWEVTPAEVLGIWEWDDLRRSASWYENVILPAVNQQRQHMDRTTPLQRDISRKDLGHSESVDDTDDDIQWNASDDSYNSEEGGDLEDCHESNDSYERVCEENLSGELWKMWEDLRIV